MPLLPVVWMWLLLMSWLEGYARGQLDVVLTRTPPPATSHPNASFQFAVKGCTSSCSIRCQLDQQAFVDCSSGGVSYAELPDGRHTFEVSVSKSTGKRASALYAWTIDTVSPTATIIPSQTFTNGSNVTVHIILSEPCYGFACINESSCDLTVRGPGAPLPPTLKVVQEGINYSLMVNLSNAAVRGRIVLVMEKAFCSDAAGNMFERSNASIVIVRFDRSEVLVNVWTPIVDSQVLVNNVARTVEATNKIDDMRIYLDFTEPVVNTTQELLASLRTNIGLFEPARRKSRGNRRFAFLLTNVSKVAVVTVSLDSSRIISRAGSPVQPVSAVSFIFDQMRPQATVSTTSPAKTAGRVFPVLIQFSEPVFQFNNASAISTYSGNISNFRVLSRSTYYAEVTIERENDVVSVFIPENQTADIAGNTNLASNVLRVRHYSVPPLSAALYSLITVGFLSTALFSGALSVSCATLAAAGALTSGTVSAVVTDPSRNLLGMASHLQVFALSEWLTVTLPTEYHETVRGLAWLIPHVKVPWERKTALSDTFFLEPRAPSLAKTRWQKAHGRFLSGAREQGCTSALQRGRKLGSNASVFGPALRAAEYEGYFENRRTLSLQDLLRHKHTGWIDLERNMFWLAVAAVSLTLAHVATLMFLRWRTKTSVRGALTVPRLELFVALLSLPCICQASAFVVSGGTVGGIVVGVLLAAFPAAFILCVLLFLVVGVGTGAIVEYHEVALAAGPSSCVRAAVACVVGRESIGRWVRKAGVSSAFLARYGLLFEDRKGAARLVVVEERWVESGSTGIGRMKQWEEGAAPPPAVVRRWARAVGGARTTYIVVDMVRRVAVAVLLGAYSGGWQQHGGVSQALALVLLTAAQLVYVLLLKPFIRRGVQTVELLSLTCEAGVFAAALALAYRATPVEDDRGVGAVMLAALLLGFTAQLVNEWYALMGLLLRLGDAGEPSLRVGLGMMLRGLLLPLIPRKHWSKFVSPQAQRQPPTGLVPVVQLSPDTRAAPAMAVAETGVRYHPGSPSLADPRSTAAAAALAQPGHQRQPQQLESSGKAQRWSEWARSLSASSSSQAKAKAGGELKILRELAKASFAAEERGKEKTASGGDTTSSSSSASSSASVEASKLETQLRKAAALPSTRTLDER